MVTQLGHLDADVVLSAFGRFARHGLVFTFVTNWSWLIYAAQMMIMAFITETPPFTCVQTQHYNTSTVMFDKKCGIETEFNKTIVCTSNQTEFYFDDNFANTLVSEWDLVCDRSYLTQMGSSIFMIGTMVSTLVVTQLSDRYGRRWTYMICCWISVLLSIASAFSPNVTVFLVIRFIMGMSTIGVSTVSWILSCELISPEFRPFMPVYCNVIWSFTYCLVGALSIWIKDWRTLTLATTAPMLLTFSYYWILPESLHWLIAHNHADRAYEWIKKMSRFNGRKINIDECTATAVPEKEKKLPQRNLLHIFKSRALVFHIAVFSYLAVTGNFVYWALSLFSTKLSEDKLTGYFLSGIIEIPAGLIGPALLLCFGRKTVGVAAEFLCGLALVILAFLPPTSAILTMTLALIGKFCTLVVFSSLYLLLPEFLPTTVRNVSYGWVTTVSRLGSVAAPYAGALVKLDKIPLVAHLKLALKRCRDGCPVCCLAATGTERQF